MQKANGILITKNERIIDIVIKLFDKIQGVDVGKFFNNTTKTDATSTNG